MSVFSLEVIAGPAHRVIVTSASIFFGCMGFVLSVITAVIHLFFPVLFRPRVPLKSNTVSRASSRQTNRRRIEAQPSHSTTASSPSFKSTDALNSVELKLPKASQSLSPWSTSPMEVQMRNSSPYPVHDYFPPMDPSPASEIPHVVVTKTSLDEAPRSSHAKQRLASTGRRPPVLCSATTVTDGALRGSRSMSFFKSKGHQRTPSDPPTSKTPSSSSETVVREKEKKKKIQVARQRTRPYEAPYFVPTPVSPSSTEFLRPRPNPVRSQTMPFPQRRAT
ncbi:MAG: hypothetical protein NXY57DRAFT_416281 [Lentinula lateritia]|uniref:Uncharacterized protein n=1 Tax=Lentinula lateritia TaxID=40482 RepID=A0ABQ8VA57_9AGAR|nr:MAG: hypothetical protein NXY57DRAFT_416281 [Lentinula lateritia]KAJ4477974.1 hypothetical protein C8R41DRAFT_922979 [Lentinula lateritia]